MNVASADTKLAYSIDFVSASRLGRTRLYGAIAAGQLRARKFGKRTVILVDDGRAFLMSLPQRSAA